MAGRRCIEPARERLSEGVLPGFQRVADFAGTGGGGELASFDRRRGVGSPWLAGFFWALLYFVIVLSPLLLMPLSPAPVARGFGAELSSALGFIGLMQLGLQFVLIARFRRLTEPYGIDIILRYHKQIGIASLLLVLSHAAVAVGANPVLAGALIDPARGGPTLWSGLATTVVLMLLIALSIGRRRLAVGYEVWRVSHALLGCVILAGAVYHVTAAGVYVNAPWKQIFWGIFGACMFGVLAYLRAVMPAAQRRYPYRVVGVERDRGRTWKLSVEADGHAGLRFLPGQFVWLRLGRSHTIDEHPFSFTSSAERAERLEFGIKELGDFTATIGDVAVGTPAYLDGPHGSLSIDRSPAAGYVFIAGGIGIAPIISMLRTMADRGDRRPALLFYADGAWDDMPFRDDVEELKPRMELTVHYVVTNPPPGWKGETGWVTVALLDKLLPKESIRRDFFVCGPNPMIDAVEAALAELGVAPSSIHAERFTLV
jgi:predicted ferric reductase